MVHKSAATAHAKHLGSDAAVLVVRTTYRPLGAAKITREILAKRDTVSVGKATEEHYVRLPPKPKRSILEDHPHMLMLPGFKTHVRMSDIVSMPTLKQHRTKRTASKTGRKMSRIFWPLPLLSTTPRRKSVVPKGTWQFSRLLGMRRTS